MAKHVSEKIESYKERIAKMKCVLIEDVIRTMNSAGKIIADIRHDGLFNVDLKVYECTGFRVRSEELFVIIKSQNSDKNGLLPAKQFNYEHLLEMVEVLGI